MAKDPISPPDSDRVALATFALLAADRQDRAGVSELKPIEQILKDIGFTPNEVHALTGENLNTVKSRMYATSAASNPKSKAKSAKSNTKSKAKK